MNLMAVIGYHLPELNLGLAVQEYFQNSEYARNVEFYQVKNAGPEGREIYPEADKEIREYLDNHIDIDGMVDIHFGGGETIQEMEYIGGDGTLIFAYYGMDIETSAELANRLKDEIFDPESESLIAETYRKGPSNRIIPVLFIEGMLSEQSEQEKNAFYYALLEDCSWAIAVFYDFLETQI